MKRWVDDAELRRKQIVEGTVVLGVLAVFFLVVLILGIMWGRLDRDCDYMQRHMSESSTLPEYCLFHDDWVA